MAKDGTASRNNRGGLLRLTPNWLCSWARPLGNPNFALLWIGTLVSTAGDEIYELALMWYVLQATGSALDTGAVPAFGFAAQLTVGLIAGTVVDRWPRKRIMVAADVCSASLVSISAALALVHVLPLWYVYFSSFALEAVGQFFGPASGAVLPDIIGEAQLLEANSLMATTRRLVMFSGRGIGGGIIALTGAALGLTVNALSFAISAIATSFARIPEVRREPDPDARGLAGLWRDGLEGLHFLRTNAALTAVLIVGLLANFGGGLPFGLTAVLVSRQLHTGPGVLGTLAAASAAGQVIGSAAVGAWGRRLPMHMTLAFSLVTGGAVLLGLTAVSWWPVATMLYVVEGIAFAVANLPIITLLQVNTPTQLRGRVFTAFAVLVNLGSPIAVTLGAFGAAVFGLSRVYAAGGLLVILTGLWAWGRPGLRARPT